MCILRPFCQSAIGFSVYLFIAWGPRPKGGGGGPFAAGGWGL